ncbi:Vam6/Vps39-like protein [Quaeritorhiza haematococci]|nr:Vam6/Vps39-like protein [Quaeritorhiza haematococci]
MYDVFHVQPIIESLPLKIESVDSFENNLVLGTNDGSLLFYHMEEEPVFSIELVDSRKNLLRKPVEQLCAFPVTNLLFALADGTVHVLELSTLTPRMQLQNIKGAHFLAPYEPTPSITAEAAKGSKDEWARIHCSLAVAVKKLLHLYQYDGDNLSDVKQIHLPDKPKSVAWIDPNQLLVALPKGYYVVDIGAAKLRNVLAAPASSSMVSISSASSLSLIGGLTSTVASGSKSGACCMSRVSETQFLLTRDSKYSV